MVDEPPGRVSTFAADGLGAPLRMSARPREQPLSRGHATGAIGAYSVEKLDRRFFDDDFGGLKPSPDQFASL
jgi:hypothetical protein